MKRFLVRSILVACGALGGFSPAGAQDAATYFRQNCTSCHTVGGGRLTGPDLKDVTARQDRAWLARFIVSPQAVIDSGDPYALKILQEARGVIMPPSPGITPQLAEALLDLIEAESALPRSQFAGVQVSDRVFTASDVERGRALFRGEQRLASGGPSCLSCHTARDVGGLGGGHLAPDLTRVVERLQGRAGLSAWLDAPPTPTMRTLFAEARLTDEELEALVAYFEDAARGTGEAGRGGLLTFVLLGLGVTVVGLLTMEAAWRTRLRSVRRALVARCRLTRS